MCLITSGTLLSISTRRDRRGGPAASLQFRPQESAVHEALAGKPVKAFDLAVYEVTRAARALVRQLHDPLRPRRIGP